MQADVLGIYIGVIGIIIGIVASYYFYRKSIRAKEPCYSITGVNLISGFGSQFEKLDIKYARKKIENLTVSKVIFWNNGRETINSNDIPQAAPLAIIPSKDIKILDAKILESNNPASQAKIELSEKGNFILLRFDYLDWKEGVVIQVIHTGKSPYKIFMIGNIKGAKELNLKWPKGKERLVPTIMIWFTIMTSFILGGGSALDLFWSSSPSIIPQWTSITMLVVGTIGFIVSLVPKK